MRHRVLFGSLVLAPLLLFRIASRSDPLPQFPHLMLWAWETPQDLRFVKPGRAGIAFLSRTIFLAGSAARTRPRASAAPLQPGSRTDGRRADRSARGRVSRGRGRGAGDDPRGPIPGVRALQVDFDARASQREWYREFLRALRAALSPDVPLTITALESWCEEDAWIRDLPVADATPMLFRLGPGEPAMPSGFPSAVCSASVGVSTDELPNRIPPARRIYFFHPVAWTSGAYDAAVAQAARWRR